MHALVHIYQLNVETAAFIRHRHGKTWPSDFVLNSLEASIILEEFFQSCLQLLRKKKLRNLIKNEISKYKHNDTHIQTDTCLHHAWMHA